MKKSSLKRQKTKRTVFLFRFFLPECGHTTMSANGGVVGNGIVEIDSSHLAIVVLVQNPAPARIDFLVALARTTHCQRRIHMHVVAGQVEAD